MARTLSEIDSRWRALHWCSRYARSVEADRTRYGCFPWLALGAALLALQAALLAVSFQFEYTRPVTEQPIGLMSALLVVAGAVYLALFSSHPAHPGSCPNPRPHPRPGRAGRAGLARARNALGRDPRRRLLPLPLGWRSGGKRPQPVPTITARSFTHRPVGSGKSARHPIPLGRTGVRTHQLSLARDPLSPVSPGGFRAEPSDRAVQPAGMAWLTAGVRAGHPRPAHRIAARARLLATVGRVVLVEPRCW